MLSNAVDGPGALVRFKLTHYPEFPCWWLSIVAVNRAG